MSPTPYPWPRLVAALPALLFGVSVAVAYPVHFRDIVFLDEGALLHIAERLAAGEVLYRDVATGLMPGGYYLYALLLSLFGAAVEVGRTAQMVVLGANTTLVYLLAVRFTRRRVATSVAVLFLALEVFPYRFPNYSPPALLLLLLGVLLFLRFLGRGTERTLILSGLCLSLSFLTKQNYGLLVFAALVATLGLDWWRHKNTRAFRSIVLFVAAFCLPALAVLLYLVAVGALHDFYRYSFSSLLSETLPSFYKPYPLLDWRDPLSFVDDLHNYSPFNPLIHFFGEEVPELPFILAVLAVYFLPLAVFAGAGLSLLRRLGRGRAALPEVALYLAAAGLFAGVYPRSDFHHLVLVLPLPLVLAGASYERLRLSLRSRLPAVTVVAVAGAVALASLVPPYMPIFWDLPERLTVPLDVERARHIRVAERRARTVHQVLDYLEGRVARDQPILVLPNDPLFYFLSRRPNPSPFPLALPGSFDEEALLASLPRAEYLVYRDSIYDGTPLEKLFPELGRRIREGYAIEEEYLAGLDEPDLPPVLVLRRRQEPRRESGVSLLEFVDRAAMQILTFQGQSVPLDEDEGRVGQAPWLLVPSLALRPPSGWQKLVVSLALDLPASPRLELSLALAPSPPWTRRDGAELEIFAYDREEQTLRRLLKHYFPPHHPDSWRWRPLRVELDGLGNRPVVLAFVATSGPRLDEQGDEILLGDPRIVSLRGHDGLRFEDVREGHTVLAALASELARMEDPEGFLGGLGRWPLDPRIHLHLGQVYARLGRGEEGLATLRRAAELDPGEAEIHLAMAELHLSRGQVPQARDEYREVLSREPGNPSALGRLAEIALEQDGDPQKAHGLAKKALRHAPDEARWYLTLGRAAHALERRAEAVKAWVRALERAPRNPLALDLLNRFYRGDTLFVDSRVLSRLDAPLPDGGFQSRLVPRFQRPPDGAAGEPWPATVEVHNLSPLTWPALGRPDGTMRIALGYRWLDAAGETIVAEGRTLLPQDLPAGSAVLLQPQVQRPPRPGTYLLRLDLLQEGVTWFAERGGEAILREVVVE